MSDPRSRIPSMDALLASPDIDSLMADAGRGQVVDALRVSVALMREAIGRGDELAQDSVEDATWYVEHAAKLLTAAAVPSLRRVINATGVVLHTNLGRAPLADEALEAMRSTATYSNLEFDLDQGVRGSRYTHCVRLLCDLTGAEDALVVNNAAGALVLSMSTVGLGRGVAVSRGELVEIGGGFRIPEVVERSGASLVEVGSTNRTRGDDYEEVVASGEAEAILKVHRSNFRITGFTEEASVAELVEIAAGHGIPVVYDLGSGLMLPAQDIGLPEEPRAEASVSAGADAVVISGDKLLGGPQAGIIVGRAELIGRMRKNPLCRALRVDKVTLAGLEATLRLYLDPQRVLERIPTLRMLSMNGDTLKAIAEKVVGGLVAAGVSCAVVPTKGAVGGGTYPGVELDSWAVELEGPKGAQALANALREGSPPVVGRLVDDKLRLDVRTLLPGEAEVIAARVIEAVSRSREDQT
ncbi:MAG: L-seryl-tRNA(Sec) selenium transferase [Longimicrobiales bacterium]|nr:L-seryl-tRNA(Sec) selenium transferase [Longimicrobiales bacterium]